MGSGWAFGFFTEDVDCRNAHFLEFGFLFLQLHELFHAEWSPVGSAEYEDDVFSFVVREGDGFIISAVEGEVAGLISDFNFWRCVGSLE